MNRHRLLRAAILAMVAATVWPAKAQDPTPVGLWRTIDDTTGAARSLVRITNTQGVLQGVVEQSLDPRDAPDARCTRCSDARKDQPIVGMAILTGLRSTAPSGATWDGGAILDPDSGTSYRARLQLRPDGRELEVRGYVGLSLFGRTQVWQRVE